MRTYTKTVVLGIAVGLLCGVGARAGSLNPTNAPGSTMHTLEEIYQKLVDIQNEMQVMQDRMEAAGLFKPPENMVLIRGGAFIMGGPASDFSQDPRSISVGAST